MLSIITITKNDPTGLKRTLVSTQAIRSKWDEIEQLVIDGSDDKMALENHETCKAQPNVFHIRREAKGISDAFNYGIEKAIHKWLWFLNGGDELNSELSLSFFHSFLDNVKADILIFQLKLMQKGVDVPFPPIHKCFPPVIPWIPHPATIIRKEVFAAHGPFDEKYKIAMDYEMWLRVFGAHVLVNMVSIPLTLFDENGLSSTETRMASFEGKEVIRKYRSHLFKLWFNSGRNIFKQLRRFKKSINGN